MFLSQFKQNHMLLMYYPFIIGKDSPDYAKHSTWNLLYAYIDAHTQRLIYEYIGGGVQAITIL